MTPYRTLLQDAWHMTWNHKSWWLFGIFAALLGNGSALLLLADNIRSFTAQTERVAIWSSFLSKQDIGNFFRGLATSVQTEPAAFLSLLVFWLVLLLLALIVIWFVTTSIAALIHFPLVAQQGGQVQWLLLLQDIKKNFWNILGILALFRVSLFIVTLLVSSLLLLLQHQGMQLVIGWLGVVFILLLSLLVYFLIPFSIATLLMQNGTLLSALRESVRIVLGHWLVNIEVALLLVGIQLVVKFLWGIASLLLLVPFILLGFIFFFLGLPGGISGTIVVALVIVTVLFLIFIGLLTTFQYSVWVLLYLSFQNEKSPTSKLLRLAAHVRTLLPLHKKS